MLERLSIKQLIVTLFFLGLVILTIKYFDFTKQTKKQLKFDQIDIDTSRLTAIYVYPKSGKAYDFVLFKDKKDKRWEIVNEKDSLGNPVSNSVLQNILKELYKLSKDSLYSETQKDWSKSGLDSNGTSILLVYDFDKRALEFLIGETQLNQKALFRVKGEAKIYQTDSKVFEHLNQDIKNFSSNQNYFSIPIQDWVQIEFNLPAFGNYKMIKSNGKWFIGDSLVSNKKIEDYYYRIESVVDTLIHIEDPFNKPTNLDFSLILNRTDTICGYTSGNDVLICNKGVSNNLYESFELFESVFVSEKFWLN